MSIFERRTTQSLSYRTGDIRDPQVTTADEITARAIQAAQRTFADAETAAVAQANIEFIHAQLAIVTLPFEILLTSLAQDAETIRRARLPKVVKRRKIKIRRKVQESPPSHHTHESVMISSTGKEYPYRIGYLVQGEGEQRRVIPDYYEQRLVQGNATPEERGYGNESDWFHIKCKEGKLDAVSLHLPRAAVSQGLLESPEVQPLVSLKDRLFIDSSLRLDLSFSSLLENPQLDMTHLIARRRQGEIYYSRYGRTHLKYVFQPASNIFEGSSPHRKFTNTQHSPKVYSDLLSGALHLIPAQSSY